MAKTFKQLKRIMVGILGITILAIGLILVFTPGPGFLVIPLGLSILATEYIWAETVLKKLKERINRFTGKEVEVNSD